MTNRYGTGGIKVNLNFHVAMLKCQLHMAITCVSGLVSSFPISGKVPQAKPRQRELTLVKANLTRVTSPPHSSTGGPVLSSLYPSLNSFPSFIFPGASYRIFFLFLSWLPSHFYCFVVTKTTAHQIYVKMPSK